VRWPARLERIADVLLDAAHNPQAARALARVLGGETPVLLVAVSADKDAGGILAPLVPLARAVVVTEAPSPRAMPAARLAAHAPGATAVPDWREALARARELAAGWGGLVVVCGSIFLAGAVRAALLGEEVDPVAVSDPAKVASR
jgi:dihydrofolate synthase/folylpolyglutamate synthase